MSLLFFDTTQVVKVNSEPAKPYRKKSETV